MRFSTRAATSRHPQVLLLPENTFILLLHDKLGYEMLTHLYPLFPRRLRIGATGIAAARVVREARLSTGCAVLRIRLEGAGTGLRVARGPRVVVV